jgi:hypothetical protein
MPFEGFHDVGDASDDFCACNIRSPALRYFCRITYLFRLQINPVITIV